ncbi:MAG: 30S ribosomal protein S8 [Gammaproteobacteria bacterium]|nr:30S ribosomal protein S8 [Gammaproteobacteria bacterium]MDD9798956.1 30S ribosomal protein S8 [Gammaproteobacteria bacterium]MDD9815940.1 30S ribosomal protein S8 [Gammaproteobacteria bacterium]MDD9850710.1 30S ribosomal protein S8 [Gammaproteobacteria bacterium]MDD9870794.1 30S ribosomal protein S8 [Gammaproteobacteria bacterium]
MTMTDPVADMLTRIRNALLRRKPWVAMPASKLKESIARVLRDEGYILDYSVAADGARRTLDIQLKYHEGRPVIDSLQRVSRPGRRVFVGRDELPTVIGGMGTAIISTSSGIMTGGAARRKGIGGEVLCKVQ